MSKLLIMVAISSLLLGGCTKHGAAPAPKSVPPPESTPEVGASAEPTDAPPTSLSATASSEEPLTDGQVIEVLAAFNNGEIEQAKVALQRSKNTSVREFAERMLRQHAHLQSKGMLVSQQTQITPADSPLGKRVAYEAREFVDSLRTVEDDGLNALYIDAEAGEHKDVRELVRNRLVRFETRKELRDLVAENLSTIEKHVTEAQRIERELRPESGRSGTASP